MAEIRNRAIGLGALVLMGMTAACAAGGPIPGPATTADTAMTLTAADGSKVAVSQWLPKKSPKAIILGLHGYGDYGPSTFTKAALAWRSHGIATIAPDQRGFGRNPSRGKWPGANALIADARTYMDQVRSRFPCTPVVLLGHSMGGGVALAAAPDIRADGLVLAAPAIWGGTNLNPIHRAAAWLAASVVPDRRISGRGVVRIQASDNIEALRALGRDPLYLAPPSAREIFGLVRITDRAHAAAARAGLPALMLLGDKDQIVPNATVRSVFDTLPGPRRTIAYDEGWHLLFRDLQAARVWQDVSDWTLSLSPPACRKGST